MSKLTSSNLKSFSLKQYQEEAKTEANTISLEGLAHQGVFDKDNVLLVIDRKKGIAVEIAQEMISSYEVIDKTKVGVKVKLDIQKGAPLVTLALYDTVDRLKFKLDVLRHRGPIPSIPGIGSGGIGAVGADMCACGCNCPSCGCGCPCSCNDDDLSSTASGLSNASAKLTSGANFSSTWSGLETSTSGRSGNIALGGGVLGTLDPGPWGGGQIDPLP